MNYKGIIAASVLALLAFALPTPGSAAGVDPAVGTWNLDLAKSKPDPSEPALKSETRVYTAAEGGLTVAVQAEDAEGSHSTGVTFTYDGKQHPIANVPNYDTVAVKRLSRNLSRTTLIRGGKTIGHLVRRVSKDGKTMTITVDLTNVKGTKVHDVLVYDRQ